LEFQPKKLHENMEERDKKNLMKIEVKNVPRFVTSSEGMAHTTVRAGCPLEIF